MCLLTTPLNPIPCIFISEVPEGQSPLSVVLSFFHLCMTALPEVSSSVEAPGDRHGGYVYLQRLFILVIQAFIRATI